MTPIRVLWANDQPLVRAGLRMLLSTVPDIEVVGEATDGESAVRLARELTADVVLMDIRMHGIDGLEATRRISADEDLAGVRVVILTTFDIDDYVFGSRPCRLGPAAFSSRTPSRKNSSGLCGWRLLATRSSRPV